jgi:hypothetical protein
MAGLMPRFFFNIRTLDDAVILDSVRIEFPSLAAAKEDMQEGVTATLVEKQAAGEFLYFSAVEIVDKAGKLLSIVGFPKN